MRVKNSAISLMAALALCGLTSASAGVITVPFTDAGWYDDTGFHDHANPSYLTGEIVISDSSSPPIILRDAFFRSFFTFNLPVVSGAITSAQLQILNPIYASGDTTETLTIYDVSTPVASLSPSTTGSTAVFADLGSGIAYGAQSVSLSDDGKYVSVGLNSAAIAALSAAAPGAFAFGGALTTLNSPATEFVFGGTQDIRDARLILTTVPEPATLALLGLGLAGLGFSRRPKSN